MGFLYVQACTYMCAYTRCASGRKYTTESANEHKWQGEKLSQANIVEAQKGNMAKDTDIAKTSNEPVEINADSLFSKISAIIERGRRYVTTTANLAEVYTKFQIGKYIVEDEQAGHYRAQYGKRVLETLSAELTEKYGDGWSYRNLREYKQFYNMYSTTTDVPSAELMISDEGEINLANTARQMSASNMADTARHFILSWSHYLILMRIKNDKERRFYEIESARQQWSYRQLSRQVGSSLYERLALSRDKNEVLRLATEGQTIEKPQDIIKNPLTLEFLGLRQEKTYTESKLETAIIDKLQDFLLELGKGFLFEARQKRFTFNEEHFFVDLVTYNRILQCYVLIDLKKNKLTHQDLGQMQMYVNYYDRYIKLPHEKPTIGILLCQEKNDALVELTLPKDANIYAAEYALYLPDKKELQQKLKEWTEEFNEDN